MSDSTICRTTPTRWTTWPIPTIPTVPTTQGIIAGDLVATEGAIAGERLSYTIAAAVVEEEAPGEAGEEEAAKAEGEE